VLQLLNCRYANINAKLKGMHSNGLTKEDIRKLSKQNNLKNAIYFLKTELDLLNNIDENSSRDEIEEELSNITINNIYKIERLLSRKEKKIFRNFISKYEIRCIKEVLREISRKFDSNFQKENINIWTNKIFKNINGISDVKTKEEFLEKIKNTQYYKYIKKKIENDR
jgi:vacuolar-type H+-ATPase subunit C/Vma6